MTKNFLIPVIILAGIIYLNVPSSAQDMINGPQTLSPSFTDSVSWANAGPAEMELFIGDKFQVLTSDNAQMSLTLADVIPGADDPNRPAFIPRKQGLIAVFAANPEQKAWLSQNGSEVVKIWHPKLGQEALLLSLVAQADGSFTLEINLN